VTSNLVARLLAVLPQTQCTRCSYPDCASYAQAIASGDAAINQCPPGGEQGVARLAAITRQPVTPLNPEHGPEAPRTLAVIDEAWCIGCTLCINACPTDAIIGTNKMMHTVIEPYCTGCELCLPVCPVDCISLENVTGTATGWAAWSQPLADLASDRYKVHSERMKRDEDLSTKRLINKAKTKLADLASHSRITDPQVLDKKRAIIEAALARARSKAEKAE
jgi:Na+-translocating ferredoxin:NAD+ oxidoreductase subunit B